MTPWMFECDLLTAADQVMLERMCYWWAEHMRYAEKGDFAKTERAFKLFDSIASRFGCTPSDRARLRIEVPRAGVRHRDLTADFLA
jgi:phage terminase small subunit